MDPTLEALQLKEVETAQQAFLADMDQHLFRERKFDIQARKLLPFLTLRLSPDGIRAASRHPLVKSLGSEGVGTDLLQDSIPQIGAYSAQSSGATGAGWAVAILDTGVKYTHGFLSGSLVSEACYSTPDSGADVLCHNGLPSGSTSSGAGRECNDLNYNCGHGTHVAGVAIGNGSLRDGVALSANLISIMVKSEKVGCLHGTEPCYFEAYKETDVADGLERVYQLRNTYDIASVNMSFTLSNVSGDFSATDCGADWPMVRQYVNLLTNAHIAVVAASGNSGGNLSFHNVIAPPACIGNVISVASVEKMTILPLTAMSQTISISLPREAIWKPLPHRTSIRLDLHH